MCVCECVSSVKEDVVEDDAVEPKRWEELDTVARNDENVPLSTEDKSRLDVKRQQTRRPHPLSVSLTRLFLVV